MPNLELTENQAAVVDLAFSLGVATLLGGADSKKALGMALLLHKATDEMSDEETDDLLNKMDGRLSNYKFMRVSHENDTLGSPDTGV
jgi:hypothetical protein